MTDAGDSLCAAAPAGASHAHDGNHLLSRIDELLGFSPIRVECLHQLPKELLLPRIPPAIGMRLVKEDVGGVPFDIHVEDLENTPDIAAIPRLVACRTSSTFSSDIALAVSRQRRRLRAKRLSGRLELPGEA